MTRQTAPVIPDLIRDLFATAAKGSAVQCPKNQRIQKSLKSSKYHKFNMLTPCPTLDTAHG